MASSINIDSLKATTYETIKKDDAFISFLTEDLSPNFQCILDMLKTEMDSIEITLTKDNIKIIEQLRGIKLAINPGIIKVAELRTAIGCPLWDDKRSALWGDKSKEIFGEANKEVLRYNDISVFLSKKGKKIFTNPKSINNEDIKDSISEFFESLNQLKDKEKCDELTRVFECFNKIIQKKGEVSNDAINIQLIHIEQIVRHIAIHFIKNILSTNPDFIKGKIKVNCAYYNTEKLLKYSNECTFSIINNTIIDFLSGRNIICDYLDILRIQRNILAHISSNVTKSEDRIVFAKFVLFTLLGSFYICRRNLINQAAYNKTECNEKTFSVYFNSKLNDDIADLPENEKQSITSSLPDIKLYKEVEVNPKNKYSSHIEYTILKNGKYRLEFGEGASKVSVDVPTESFWLSPSNKPIAIWTGVKTYFFSDISTIYSELDPYIHNANKEEINALNSLVTTLNHLINDLSNKTEANSSMINHLVEATKSIEESLKNLNTKVGVISKDIKSILSAVKNILFTAKILIGILCVIIVIAFSFFMYKELSHDPNPESFIEKGDRYLKDYKPEKAGEAYRKAIAGYEALLKTDSNNINANIGLATMLMRGKGKYDLERAKQCAKRAYVDKRGQGLYVYLLVLSGNYEEANKCINSIHNLNDEYAKIADALLTFYGFGREQTIETIHQAISNISNLPIQEAALEIAIMNLTGVPIKDKDNSFYIYPDPMLGINYMGILAQDSLNLTAMASLSNFLSTMGNLNAAFNTGYAALVSGMDIIAPSLIIQTLNDVDLEKSDDYYAQRLEKISRIAEQNNSVLTNLSRFCHSVYNYNHNRNGVTAKQLVNDLDAIIKEIENSDDDNLVKQLENLNTLRVSLCLQCGDLSRATQLAMELDNCDDSLAVSNYLMGICFAKGYGDIPIDTIASMQYICKAADSGYPKAIYTRLRNASPLEYKIEKNSYHNAAYALTYSKDLGIIKTTNETTNNPTDSTSYKPTGFGVGSGSVEYVYVQGEPLIKVNSDGTQTRYTFVFNASKYADVADSIWQKSAQIAMELSDYWREYYRPWPIYKTLFEWEIPYIPYCPKEYQIMYNTINTCYEYGDLDNHSGFTNRPLPKAILEEQMLQLQIGISSALDHRNGELARHLITMWVTLAEDYGVEENILSFYKEYVLPEYKDEKKYIPYKKIDYPKFLY